MCAMVSVITVVATASHSGHGSQIFEISCSYAYFQVKELRKIVQLSRECRRKYYSFYKLFLICFMQGPIFRRGMKEKCPPQLLDILKLFYLIGSICVL